VSGWAALADRAKTALALEHEPIAVAFSRGAPAGLAEYESSQPLAMDGGRTGAVPAGCCFWADAEQSSFATSAADHANCSVGSYTHGLVSLEQAAAGDDTQALLASGWVAEADLASAPAVAGAPTRVSYGPLAEAAFVPEVVLLRLTPQALMTLHGACPDLVLAGKPQCQIVPLAREHAQLVASLGCAVSRARTGLPAGEMTCALPAGQLASVVELLERAAEADRVVAGFAAADRARFGSA
jgi:uncharacterized protein (DUF169 family)